MKHLQQMKMLTAYNEVRPKVIRNLCGTLTCDFGIQSVERSRPGYSLHQGASSWNDAPAAAAPGQKVRTRPGKPHYGDISPNHIQQHHLATAHLAKQWNVHRLQATFQGRNS